MLASTQTYVSNNDAASIVLWLCVSFVKFKFIRKKASGIVCKRKHFHIEAEIS